MSKRPRYVREAHRALSAITVLLAKVRALQDEIADRANVEADLRAQLAETKADLPPSFGFRETDGSIHSDGR